MTNTYLHVGTETPQVFGPDELHTWPDGGARRAAAGHYALPLPDSETATLTGTLDELADWLSGALLAVHAAAFAASGIDPAVYGTTTDAWARARSAMRGAVGQRTADEAAAALATAGLAPVPSGPLATTDLQPRRMYALVTVQDTAAVETAVCDRCRPLARPLPAAHDDIASTELQDCTGNTALTCQVCDRSVPDTSWSTP